VLAKSFSSNFQPPSNDKCIFHAWNSWPYSSWFYDTLEANEANSGDGEAPPPTFNDRPIHYLDNEMREPSTWMRSSPVWVSSLLDNAFHFAQSGHSYDPTHSFNSSTNGSDGLDYQVHGIVSA
jgi:hypothetical protein